MQSKKLKVLVLGYGAREHALAWKIVQSPQVGRIFVAPGNAGTGEIATNVPISDEDVPGLVAFAQQNQIDLTVVGTNDPLAFGVVDAFQAAGLAIFGPQQAAARLEYSKAFAKRFMQRHNIPTPRFATFHSYDEAVAYLDTLPHGRLVVKVSGLGKMGLGVTVCDTKAQARAALHSYMVHKLLGDAAAQTVIIEERLSGPELSMFALSDGKTAVPLFPVRDHKRIFDGDNGPNTGGMGAFAPVPGLPANFEANVMKNIIQPTIDGMAAEGNPYVGVLFAGLMLTERGVQVLEFNCRFGNPETLVLMALLESDLVEAMLACIHGKLTPAHIQISDGAAAAVMLASPSYPAESFPTGLPITGTRLARALPSVNLFHHGTKLENGRLLTSRGRVLAVIGSGSSLSCALKQAYRGVDHIHFAGAQYRSDIGGGIPQLPRRPILGWYEKRIRVRPVLSEAEATAV
ncbi:phosphoribosylamine--glycine ligase [Candidatus Leptofilum sp.]|uniref:phosphoribosylamine--glycine ligase n=1 Tax=Candidatus Leptofilum sp. TaxID=3241576 RepID=UPI003B5A3C3F